MKKKNRRFIFMISALVFVILSFLMVFFALGYRYDFVQHKFLKTGSLELKTNVSAEVYINDELAGSTSFLSNSFSKGQLLPRTYNVRVQNEKYQPWQKLVKIEAGFLTGFPRITLLPQNFSEELIASGSLADISVKRFEPDEDLAVIGNRQKLESISLENGKKELIKNEPRIKSTGPGQTKNRNTFIVSPDGNKNAWIDGNEIWAKWLKDSGYQPLKIAGETEFIARFSQAVNDLQWFKDSEHLIISVGGLLKFVEIDKRGGVNIFDISNISGPFYYDRGRNAIFKFEDNRLVKINLK